MIGDLSLYLYGTRDAALNWQGTLSSHFVKFGLVRSKAYPCIFVHPVHDLLTLVQGTTMSPAARRTNSIGCRKNLGSPKSWRAPESAQAQAERGTC